MGHHFLSLSERGKNGPARWIGGTLVILFCWFIVGGMSSAPLLVSAGVSNAAALADPNSDADPFLFYLAVNVGFGALLLGLWLAVRLIHQRAFRTLVTPATRVSWARMGLGFAVWFIIVALGSLVEFALYPSRFALTFDPSRWFFFLPFVLVLTPIQTSAEELFFRGYWLQGIGRLTRHPLILILITSLLFAIPHLANPEVTNHPESGLLLFLNYFAIGAVLAWITLRDNRLELALGVHAANNLFAALIVNYTTSVLMTPAVITNNTIDATLGLLMILVGGVLFYLIVFRLCDSRLPFAA